MNGDERSVDLLRDTLRAKADQASIDLTVGDIRRQVAARRQARRRLAMAVAAAAVVAVTVPTALVLRDEGAPAPTPAPTATPTTAPTATPSSTAPSPTPTATDLASVPRGKDPNVAYLRAGVVHEPGNATAQLPGQTGDVTQFTGYHGGWLVIDSTGQLVEYDNTGAVVLRSHQGDSSIAVSGDGMRTAFSVDGRVRMGITTGMGQGEQVWTTAGSPSLVGMLAEGPVVVDATGSKVLTANGTTRDLKLGGVLPTATSDAAGLVGGITGTVAKDDLRGAVADATSGTVLWRNAWRPLRFSADGRYVAAAPVADNGDPSAVAIVDARTGDLIARTPELHGVSLPWQVAWDGDRVLFEAVGDRGRQRALLALDVGGRLTRASDVAPAEPGSTGFEFPVQP